MTRTSHNFTLIEMLTVIAIIAILAGLIIPAVGRARVSAKTAACISNQGQTMKIIQQSINDNDGYFISGTTADTNYWSVWLYNKNYIQDFNGIRCPAIVTYTITSVDPSDTNAATQMESALQQVYGAAYTSIADGFDFRGTKYLLTAADDDDDPDPVAPAALAIGCCAADYDADSGQKLASAVVGFSSSDGNRAAPYKIHGNFCNFFFFDGHAESLEQTEAQTRYYPLSGNTPGAEQISRDYITQ